MRIILRGCKCVVQECAFHLLYPMATKKNSKKEGEALDERQEFIEKICNKFREMREESGLTQEIFAYEHGFDRKQWHNIENVVDMKLSTLYRAIAALHTTPAEFFKDFK